jgi:hypothetical protein
VIGIQTVTGGLIGLLVIGALTLSTVAGIAAGIYFVLTKRHKRALVLLGASLPIAAVVATGWLAIFKTPPQRDVVIDFRRETPPQWVAGNFSSCRSVPIPPVTTTCDSNDHINNVRLTLPDGIELQATARMMSVSYVKSSSRLKSINLVVHPYLSATQTTLLHRELTGKLSAGAKNASAVAKRSAEVEQWLTERQGSGSPQLHLKRDDYICAERQSYKTCVRYRAPSTGQGLMVIYEIEAAD